MYSFKCGHCLNRSYGSYPVPYIHEEAAAGTYITIPVFSAYLGSVNLSCLNLGRGNVALRSVAKGSPDIYVSTIDAVVNRLQVQTINYPLSYLMRLPATVVNVNECKRHHDIISALRAKDSRTPEEQQTLHQSLIHNIGVDIHFNTCNYLDFLHERIGINNIISGNTLVSIHNVTQFDNAFFSGSYMCYGNGDSLFFPLGAVDTTGHEASHAVVQLFAGLIYQGHPGALNESFADVMGVCFEFYLYNRFTALEGKSDWTLGEDMGKRIKYLRNMADPTAAEMPQPKLYRGPLWADPNGAQDNGGVHTNSGVANYCFYLYAQQVGVDKALDAWIEALKQLMPSSSFLDFRDAIGKTGGWQTTHCLEMVGLDEAAVSDWHPQNPPK